MNRRAAKRTARRVLAQHARVLARLDDGSPDGERLADAYTDLAQFLDPRPLVMPIDPDQLALDVGATPDAGG